MKKPVLRILALLMIPLLIIGALPQVDHHDHEAEVHCDGSDPTLESDACHVRLHHFLASESEQCSHPTHVDKDAVDCELCTFLTGIRYQALLPAAESSTDFSVVQADRTPFVFHLLSRDADSYGVRGPPALL